MYSAGDLRGDPFALSGHFPGQGQRAHPQVAASRGDPRAPLNPKLNPVPPTKQIAINAIAGAAAFLAVMVSFTYLYHHSWEWVWILSGSIAAIGWAMVTTNPAAQPGGRRTTGALVVIAVIFGAIAGQRNYAKHMATYYNYSGSREFTDVLPTEPAAAHADAGKITFASVAMVDTTKSVGYKKGDTYCVAPIMEPSSGQRVEFWAVGMNCCSGRNDFRCGDVGSPAVKSGVVLMDWDTNSLLPTQHEYYLKAVKEAEAAFDLVSASEPLLLFWTKDPAGYVASMHTAAIGDLTVCTLFYAVFNTMVAYFSMQA